MNQDSKRYDHLKNLQKAGASGIESWKLAEESGLQVNTSNKYVLYLRREGHIIITDGIEGKPNCKYTYHGVKNFADDPIQKLLGDIENVLSDYPVDHIEAEKILLQREQILRKKSIAA
jgi:hypothetical protein